MNKRNIVSAVLLIALALVLINNIRRGGGEEVATAQIDERYMVCSACGAEYDVEHDHLANMDPADLADGPDSILARCDVCGEIAARLGMRVDLGDGE